MKIIKAEEQKQMPGPADWFTGTTKVRMLIGAEDPGRTGTAEVTFEAGARTAWHTHPLGQILIVTDGTGWVQKEGESKQEINKGDVVWFAAGEKHWHGATDSTAVTDIAIQEAQDGKSVEWMEHVSDDDYLA